MPVRAILFDFDGTLADSFKPITSSTNHVRQIYGLPPLPESDVRRYVGLGLANLMETLVPNANLDEAIAQYSTHHQTVMLTETRLMPGVAETIPELSRRGFRLAVCSNKRVEFTQQLVHVLGLSQYFKAVLGPEDVGNRPKPDPAMLLEGLKRLDVLVADALYVGDMAVDIHTAQAAGITVWLVPGGATGTESARDAGPNRVLTGIAEMLALLPTQATG
jgi:2-phosphoglycolate phosphatase